MKQTLEPMNPRILEPFIFILFFGLFLATLHPTITAGDSGEIVAATYSSGIPHPPGYPLYAIVSKLLTLSLPFGSIAFRVNVVSALFGALSCWMVYLITSKIIRSGVRSQESGANVSRLTSHISHLPALFAASSLALSYEFWYRSTVAEVYTLNTFLILMMIYILLVWRDTVAVPFMGNVHSLGVNPNATAGLRLSFTDSTIQRFNNSRLLYLASFLLGLGIGNHHTIVLIVPGIVAFVSWNIFKKSGVRSQESGVSTPQPLNFSTSFLRLTSHVSRLTFFFLLGLSIYLYLPIRSSQNPFMDWGDPQALSNFIDVFTRRSYLPEEMGRNWGMFVAQIRSFNPIREFTLAGIFFGPLGAWGLWNSDKATLSMMVITFLLTSYGLILLAGGSTGDVNLLRKFYLPSYAIFSIFMGIGVATALNFSTSQLLNLSTSIFYILAAVSLIWQFAVHYPRTRNSNNYLAYDYGMNELNSLRKGATYISKGEVKTFPLWYMQGVERYREDVKVVTAYFLTQRWYLKDVLKSVGVPSVIPQDLTYKQMLINSIYRGNADKGVYTGFIDEEYIPKDLLTYTQGITFQLYKDPGERAAKDIWPFYRLRGVKRIEDGMEMGTLEILKDYASSHYNTGLEYYQEGDKQKALSEFEKALAINPDDPDSLNNLAVLYAEKGIKLKEAEVMAKKAFELYTGEKDREMAKETLEEILKKR